MSEHELVPLMYQAQLPERGKIQYAGDAQPATRWVRQWLKGCPPVPDILEEDVPIWRRSQTQPTVKMPQFGTKVQLWKYTLSWRLVTNSGQDESINLPVIGAKGLPYYPGSSMKGAFLRACRRVCKPEEVLEYCGGEVTEDGQKKTKPGILRFHGGYPVDMSWGNEKRLIDVVHSQEPRQVMRNVTTSANVQISLHKTKFQFGISSSKDLDKAQWGKIKKIWESALSEGIGSRVSAGYGRVEEIEDTRAIVCVNLRGEGLTSKLLNETPEFRPNMFKAALRGHTLRLLAGVTNVETAQSLTKQLWGGISGNREDNGAIVGKLGIDFHVENLIPGEHNYSPNGRRANPMPIYNLKSGRLDILSIKEVSQQEREFLNLLIKFSLLLGGFGKSWRRIHHRRFYPDYFQNNDKPMIGCHWEFSQLLEEFCLTAPRGELNNISSFLTSISDKLRNYFNLSSNNNYVTNWRDVWHPEKVQVWGRVAENRLDSEAVEWFHRDNFIKRTELTGKIGNPSQVSKIWHRMYPLYVKSGGILKPKANDAGKPKYVELLTIFTPDNLPIAQTFINYLDRNSSFIKLYPRENYS